MDYYQEKGEDPLVMALRLDPQLIKSLVLSTTILGMKYLLSVCAKTIPDQSWILEMIFGKKVDQDTLAEIKKRSGHVVGDDLENIPVGLTMLWLAGLTTSSAQLSPPSVSTTFIVVLTQVFTLSRLAHSVLSYANFTGWFRNTVYIGGFISSCGAGIIALNGLAS